MASLDRGPISKGSLEIPRCVNTVPPCWWRPLTDTYVGQSVALWSPLWVDTPAGGWVSIDGGPLMKLDLQGSSQLGSRPFVLAENLDPTMEHTVEILASLGDTLSIDMIS